VFGDAKNSSESYAPGIAKILRVPVLSSEVMVALHGGPSHGISGCKAIFVEI